MDIIEELEIRLEISDRLYEKAKKGEFKSDYEAFLWMEKERNKKGVPISYKDRIKLIHTAEQADAKRNSLSFKYTGPSFNGRT